MSDTGMKKTYLTQGQTQWKRRIWLFLLNIKAITVRIILKLCLTQGQKKEKRQDKKKGGDYV
ncbi:hypothetical protein B0X71_13895 [Planococcus lenghuensis]|uniref:Uncharacterized protein n=1 Tax=Planococcus lenghuensis TaxID=2213202 RepID=A0A1Q2L216_9BACL|nr:hypothetical protein B0X71_13895 [Planococcus lenghuensis]